MKRKMKQIAAVASVTTLVLTGCSTSAEKTNDQATVTPTETVTQDAAGSALADGTYEGIGTGNNGEIKCSVTFADGKIASVEVVEHAETSGICESAMERVPSAIMENNTVNVDTVSGATNSSKGIIAAVEDAIVKAGGKVEDFSQAVEKQAGETVQAETQVVVVGAGAAGVSAALEAVQSGAKVILLEKGASAGGASVLAGGIFAVDSNDQIEAGVANFKFRQVLEEWMDYNCWLSDANLFYNILGNSGETANWLEENGVDFTFTGNEQLAHADALPTYLTYSSNQNEIKSQYFQNMIANFEKAGGVVYYETPATELISDGSKISGVIAEQADGTRMEISCQAVVLATGGSGANKEMVESVNGFNVYTVSTGTQTGDGVKMAQAVGAGEGNLIQEFHGVTSYVESQPGLGIDVIGRTIYFPGSIWINKNGYRFAPEDINFDTALSGNVAYAQGEYYYAVISEAMVKTLETEGTAAYGVEVSPCYIPGINLYPTDSAWEGYQAALEEAIADGKVVKGNTMEELAEAMGVNVDSLVKSMATYNDYCVNKDDAMLGKEENYLISMTEGPYYAVKARPVSLGMIGGLAINSELQVLAEDGSVISGLYAAGNEIGTIYNNTYPLVEGVTLGVAFNSGRLAGDLAAEYVAK